MRIQQRVVNDVRVFDGISTAAVAAAASAHLCYRADELCVCSFVFAVAHNTYTHKHGIWQCLLLGVVHSINSYDDEKSPLHFCLVSSNNRTLSTSDGKTV